MNDEYLVGGPVLKGKAGFSAFYACKDEPVSAEPKLFSTRSFIKEEDWEIERTELNDEIFELINKNKAVRDAAVIIKGKNKRLVNKVIKLGAEVSELRRNLAKSKAKEPLDIRVVNKPAYSDQGTKIIRTTARAHKAKKVESPKEFYLRNEKGIWIWGVLASLAMCFYYLRSLAVLTFAIVLVAGISIRVILIPPKERERD